MKKIGVLAIFCLLSTGMFAQAGIKIYTLNDEAKFKIIFNGVEENVIPIKEISYDSLDISKPHKVYLRFSEDTIADIDEEFYLLEDQVREFEIIKKTEIRMKGSKVGRKITKFFKIGKHDKEGIVWDVFYLQERTKSEYLND